MVFLGKRENVEALSRSNKAANTKSDQIFDQKMVMLSSDFFKLFELSPIMVLEGKFVNGTFI